MLSVRQAVNIFAFLCSFTAILSVSHFIDPLLLLFVLLFFALSVYQEVKGKFLVNYLSSLFISLVLLIIPAVRLSVRGDILTASVEAGTVLLVVSLLQEKKIRTYLHIFLLSVFITSSRALFSLDISFLLFFLIQFFSASIGLVFTAFLSQDEKISFPFKRFLSITLKLTFIPLTAVPFTIIIFLVLPRTDYPLFSFLNQTRTVSGFKSSVSPGGTSQIEESQSVAFRFKTDKKLKELEKIYIRGAVLDYFDGIMWRRSSRSNKLLNVKHLSFDKESLIKQEIILNPYGEDYLFAINVPVEVSGLNAKIFYDFTVKGRVRTTVKYTAYSLITDHIVQPHIDKETYLQLPENLSKKLYRFATDLKGSKSDREFVQFLKDYFNQNFKYSLSDLPQGENALEKFLFEAKKGHCEFFASSTALILRINGIPARVVVGFRGVKYNNIGNYYLVLNKNAHAWVEYYLDGKWITLDTTPALASSAQNRQISFVQKVRIWMDIVNYYYLNFIVNFDFKKQKELATSLLDSFITLKEFLTVNLTRLYIFIAANLLIFIIFLLIYKVYSKLLYPLEKRLLDSFLKTLEKKGYKKKPSEGLLEFLESITDNKTKKVAKKWVEIYYSKIYKDERIDKETAKLLKNIENLLK